MAAMPFDGNLTPADPSLGKKAQDALCTGDVDFLGAETPKLAL
jgi:hypothetical protein